MAEKSAGDRMSYNGTDETSRGDMELGEDQKKEENLELEEEHDETSREVGKGVGEEAVDLKEELNGVNEDRSLRSVEPKLDKDCSKELDDQKMEDEKSLKSEGDGSGSDLMMDKTKTKVLKSEANELRDRDDEDSSLNTRPAEAESEELVTPDDHKQGETSEKVSDNAKPELTDQQSRPLKSSVRRAHLSSVHPSPKLRRSKFKPTSDVSTKSRSSIDIDISRIIHGDCGGEGGDSVTMVTTKSVDFSPQTVADEVEQELAGVVGNDDATSTFSDFRGDEPLRQTLQLTGKNSQVSFIWPEPEMPAKYQSRLQHRSLHTPVRDNIYEHAIHLIKNRCRSRTTTSISSRYPLQNPSGVSEYVWDEDEEDAPDVVSLPTLLSNMVDDPRFNCQPNSTFFIMQRQPIPLKPLKVWKGYHGNVFFQPLTCRKMRMSVSDKVPVNATPKKPAYNSRILNAALDTRFPQLSAHAKHKRATTAKTWNGRGTFTSVDARDIASAASRPVTRQMSVLDRRTVLSEMDQHFGEDITWLNGTEALGALQVGTGRSRSSAHFYDNRGQHYKLRICRGLVSHNLARLAKENPALDVNGGRMREARSGKHGRGQRGYRQSVVKVDSGSHSDDLQPQNHPLTNLNSKQVVVDLTTGSEIVKEYLVGGRLKMNLTEETNRKVK